LLKTNGAVPPDCNRGEPTLAKDIDVCMSVLQLLTVKRPTHRKQRMNSVRNLRWLVLFFVVLSSWFATPAIAAFASGTGIARVPASTGNDEGYGIALQSDGKIVMAGRCIDSGANPCVARLNADGSMDTSFNDRRGAGQARD
jgi:hypothetical protein